MLVLHPSTLMTIDGPLGRTVCVGMGVDVSVLAGIKVGSLVFVAVNVAMIGVEVATPITTGVDVKMDGVDVEGKKGVGPGRGCITQPLQDDRKNKNTINGTSFFISSPLCSLYPSY